VLARQPVDLERPRPFTEAGEREFNCLLWVPPNEQMAGDIVLVDSTNSPPFLAARRVSKLSGEISRRCGKRQFVSQALSPFLWRLMLPLWEP
jgi:hypothetical protein